MAAIKLSTLGTALTTNAAAVAAAAGGTTQANIEALGAMLTAMSNRQDLSMPPMKLTNNTELLFG